MTRFVGARGTLIAAIRDGVRIGGAIVAVDSPTLRLLDGDPDVAVLWDLRVELANRASGVGTALFRAAENWAEAQGCRQLKVETQNINVPACQLYSKEGCRPERVERGAYSELPLEVRLIWSKPLSASQF